MLVIVSYKIQKETRGFFYDSTCTEGLMKEVEERTLAWMKDNHLQRVCSVCDATISDDKSLCDTTACARMERPDAILFRMGSLCAECNTEENALAVLGVENKE